MENFGIKMSKEGYDVRSAADKNLIYSSGFNTFKIYAQGTGSVTTSSNPAGEVINLTISHTLGYRPVFWFFSQVYDYGTSSVLPEYYLMPYALNISGDFGIAVACTTTEIRIRYGQIMADPNITLGYRYVIFYNKAYQ